MAATAPPDRRWAIERSRALIEERAVFLDTETTGLDATSEVVEICIVDHGGAVLLDSLISPTGTIPPAAIAIHGIDEGMVRGAPSWAALWPRVDSILSGHPVAVYNAEFDLRMMRQSHMAHGLRWRPGDRDLSCVMRLYAAFSGQWSGRHGAYRWHTLGAAATQCGVAVSGTHRARADALLARAVLRHMADQQDG